MHIKKINLSIMPLVALSFLVNCGSKETPWYLDNNYLSSLKSEDVTKAGGVIKTIKVNNQIHRVRLIGVDHDDLSDGSAKAHTTWKFVSYISDTNGYSLATPWNWENGEESFSDDFPNSNLRKAIDGCGIGKIVWYEKGSPTKSTIYTTSVFDMLPNDLKGVLKEVKKETVTSASYELNTYNTKLFPLSYREMTGKSETRAADEGSTYSYYKGMTGDRDINRLEHQVKWHEGASDTWTKITDKELETAQAWNYAGFNSYVEYYGGYSWLRSPVTNPLARSAFQLSVGGNFLTYSIYQYALAVSPAFCI